MDDKKLSAAVAGAAEVRDGMLVGLGSGSTSALMIREVGRRCAGEGLRIRGVCTSAEVEELARESGIPIEPLSATRRIDLYLDGADQIDDEGVMIKGGGGALLREKVVALNARRRVIMVDPRKPVKKLGVGFPLPVDVVPFCTEFIAEAIRRRITPGAEIRRQVDGSVYVNSDGHHIIDCHFPEGIENPVVVSEMLRTIPGVVEVGLFFGFCDELLIGHGDRVERRTYKHHVEILD